MVTLATATASAASLGFLTGLAAMRSRLREAVREAAHARWVADHDALTGLPNRAAARRHYEQAVHAGRPCTVALLDLDDFKVVNDTWGHQAGDAQLVAIAERLSSAVRAEGGTAFRLGGDEFALLLPTADPRAALRQVTAAVAALSAALPLAVDDVRTVVTSPSASAGIATATPGGSFSETLKRADIALYHAKGDRDRSAPRLHSPELRHPAREHGGAEMVRVG
jgi:diguanylate cyclase (GGDEF)-like protein